MKSYLDQKAGMNKIKKVNISSLPINITNESIYFAVSDRD